ncbi:MAG TPA: hypothetical protein VD931_17490 [Baekduia sp.]|nr:hypothetical protein [Baekduia sp.]
MPKTSNLGRLVAGAGGGVLLASLFLPWADAGGERLTGWELWTTGDLALLAAAVTALAAALTGGRIGLFRPDLSLSGAADLLGLVSTLLVAWMLVVDFPAGADMQAGAPAALVGALAIAAGVGDYRTLRGAPAFPRLDG